LALYTNIKAFIYLLILSTNYVQLNQLVHLEKSGQVM
jgi:hypothetical protein